MLGVILAPDGNYSAQIQKSHDMAATYIGKLKHSKLSKQEKWTAVTTVLEPGVLYPLRPRKIDKILASFKCHSLGLNEHFLHAVRHGPMALGGMAIPNTMSKTTATRITYFLYHTHHNTYVGKKLDASITDLQLEIGTFQQFFSIPYQQYRHLTTTTLIKTIWGKPSPMASNCALHRIPHGALSHKAWGTKHSWILQLLVASSHKAR
jgi:hypothetical protein